MKIRDLYPLITTPLLAETRDFYVRHFGFQVGVEASWFLYLIGPGEEGARGAVLAFMHPDHPSDPPGPERFDGRGMILTVEVGDAAAAFRRLGDGGAIVAALSLSGQQHAPEDWIFQRAARAKRNASQRIISNGNGQARFIAQHLINP